MASKSKKRRRVFRASCILAALIIAGSSFAWFTSKDEVTNRLSASGDYDVSIVESFAPPAKWVPGQAVNKDVYAVNTGNVEAYVKESVSSVLTVVTEEAYDGTANKPDAESNELSAAERYVVEAGAFLAYAPVGSKFTYNATDVDGTNVKTEDVGKVKSGMKAIAMNPDFDDENGYAAANATDFQPDVEGLYIFRRTIGVDPKTQIENYTYDAYYYVPSTGATTKKVQLEGTGANEGKFAWQATGNTDPANYEWKSPSETPTTGYEQVMVDAPVDGVDEYFYKVSNLAVTPEKATFAGDLDQRDGMVATGGTYDSGAGTYAIDPAVAPTYGFYKDVTKTVVPTLTYDKLNNRLVATYNTGKTVDDPTLRGLATAYENAAINYQDALEEYAAALGDELGRNYPKTLEGTEKALQEATAALREAVDDLLAAQYAEAAAKKAYDDAVEEKNKLYDAMEAARLERDGAATNLGEANDGTDPTKDTLYARYERAEAALGVSTAPDNGSDTSAWGNENTAKKARNEAKTEYDTKKALREAATQDERNAFLDLVVPHVTPSIPDSDSTDVKREKAATYLNGLTYQQMVDLNIVNPGDTGYSYYSKLIDEKSAKDALDTAEATYEQRIRERQDAQRDYDIAKAAKEAAEASLGTGADATAVYNPATGENNTANGRYNYAKQQYENKMVELYGHAEGSTANGPTTAGANNFTAASLYGVYKEKQGLTETAQNTKNTQQGLYDDALAASGVAATNVTNAAERVAQTKQARDNAWAAYDTAYKSTTGELKININLADVVTEGGVADKWQLLPESLEDNYKNEVNATTGINEITEATDGKTDTASFYYTSILGGGETSSKLIDSVELDPSVTKEMFKYFDFDLNITLNSAQVNVDENGNYTAETAQTELGKYAILSDNTSADTAITWSDTETLPASAKAKTYKGSFKDGNDTAVADDKTGPITELTTPQIFDYEDYKYVVTVDGNTYYGKEIDNGKSFYKYDPATGTLLKENTAEVKNNVLTLDGAASQIFKVTITFKDKAGTAEDKTADYTYTGGTWSGTAPAGTTFSSTQNGSYAADIASALTAPTADGVATVWYA